MGKLGVCVSKDPWPRGGVESMELEDAAWKAASEVERTRFSAYYC
jgi:hypothetical protein